ncbi:MAG: hypothetical protein K2L90_04780, partial [Muribaculaceae bacterium]|nr:hypothetical protein [Muribaculaceae bacterium]
GDPRLATIPHMGKMRRRRMGCGSPCRHAWGKERTTIPEARRRCAACNQPPHGKDASETHRVWIPMQQCMG